MSNTTIDQIKHFKNLLDMYDKYITKDGINPDELIAWCSINGYFTTPASIKYHSNYEGGLADHSIMVAETLCDLTRQNNLHWSRPCSPVIVGLFHDICKCDQYRHSIIGQDIEGKNIYASDSWEYNTDTYLKGHGDKSVMLLSTHMRITEEEVFCIRYHMGAFTDKEEWSDYTRAIEKHPNVLWTHTADMIATHIHKT